MSDVAANQKRVWVGKVEEVDGQPMLIFPDEMETVLAELFGGEEFVMFESKDDGSFVISKIPETES